MPKTRSEAESGGELSGRKPKRQKRAIGHEEANTAAEEPRASLAVPKGMQKRESVVRPTAVVLRVVARLFAVKVLQRDAFVAGLTRMADELAAETEKYVTKIGDSLGPPGLASRVAGPDAPDSNDVNPSGQTSDDRADGSGSGESETEEISGVRPGGADSAPLSRRPSSVHGRSAHHQKRAAIGRASVAIYRGLAALLSTYTDLRLEDFVAQMQLLADQSAAAAASAGARDSAVSSTAPLATAAQTLPPTASALAAAAAADAAADAGAVAGPNAVSAATAELPAAFATAATALRELVTANSHMQVASSQTHKSAAAILKRRAKGLSVGTQPVAGAVEGNIGSSSAREGGDYGYLLALFDVLLDARGHSGHRYGDDSGKNKVSGPRGGADQRTPGAAEAEPSTVNTRPTSAGDQPASDQAPAKKPLKPRHVGGLVQPTTAFLMAVADLVAEGALRTEAVSARLTSLANQLAAEAAAMATKYKAQMEAAAARYSGQPGAMAGRGPEAAAADLDAAAGEADGPGGRVSGDEREGEAADDKANAASEGHTKEPKRRHLGPSPKWWALFAEQQAALAKGSEAIYRALDTYLLTHRDRQPAALAQELRTLVRRAGGGTTGGSTGAAAAAGADAAAAAGPAVAAAAAAATAAEPDASAQPLPGASCPATAADTPDAGAAAGAAVGCGGAVLFAPAATAGSVAASAALSALLVAHPSIRLATKVIYHNYRQRHKKQRPVGRSMDGAADTEADGRDIGGLGEEGDSDLRAFIRSLLLPRHVAKGAKAARGVDGSLEAAAAAMDTDKSDKAPAEAVDNDKSLEEAAEAVDLVMMALHGPLGVPLNRGLGAYIGNPGLLLPERGSDLDARLATVCRFLLPSGPGGGTECSQSTGHTLKVRFGCGVCAACRDPLAADPCLRPLTASSASGRGEASRQALLGAMGWDPASTYTAAADAGCVDNAGGRKRLGKQAPRVEQQEEVEHGEGAGGTDAAGRAPKRQRRDAATTSLDRGVDADPVGVAGTAAAGDGDGGGDEIEGRMEVSGGDAVSSGEEEASLPLAHRLRQLQMMQARRRPQRPQEQQQEQQDGPLPRVTNIFAVGAPDGCVVVPPSCGIFPRAIALDGMRLDGESAKIIAAELWLLIDLAVRARAVELQLDERLETKAALRGVRQPRLFYKHRARMMRGHVVYGAEAYVHANNAPAAAGAAGRRLPGWFGRLGPNRAVPQHVRKLLLVEQPQALVQAAQVVHAADLDMVALNEPLPRTAGGLGRVCPWCGHAGHHLRIFCPLRRLCAPSLGTFALQQQRQQQQVRPREAKRRRLGDQQPAVHQQHHQQGGSQLAVAAEAAALNPALAPHAPSLDLLMDAALLPRRQLLPPGSIPKSQAEAEAAEPMLRLLLSAPDAAAAQAGSGSAGLPFSWAATARVEEEEEEPAREAEGQRAAAAPGERAGLRNAVARGPGPPPAWLALLDPTTLDLMAAIDQAHPWAVGMQPVRRIEMGAGGADGAGAAAGAAAAAAEVDGSGLTSARWRVAPGPEPLSYEVLLMLALLMEESMKLQLTGEQALLEGKLPGARRAEGA